MKTSQDPDHQISQDNNSLGDSDGDEANNCEQITSTGSGQAVKITIHSSMAIFILISNIFIVVLILNKSKKITRMNFFFLHICVADITTALFTLLPEVIWSTTMPEFYGGTISCKTVKFLQMVGPYLSSYTLCMMALDRKMVKYLVKLIIRKGSTKNIIFQPKTGTRIRFRLWFLVELLL